MTGNDEHFAKFCSLSERKNGKKHRGNQFFIGNRYEALRWGGKFSIENFIFPIILRFSNSMSGRFVQKIMFSGGKRGNPALIDERGQGSAML